MGALRAGLGVGVAGGVTIATCWRVVPDGHAHLSDLGLATPLAPHALSRTGRRGVP